MKNIRLLYRKIVVHTLSTYKARFYVIKRLSRIGGGLTISKLRKIKRMEKIIDMRKMVNGKVVNIPNIELFEKAQESLAIRKTTTSVTSDKPTSEVDNNKLNKYVSLYNMFYKSMSYPLYAIEDDIKYATLGNFIKYIVGNDTKMWVDNGLYIVLDVDNMLALHIVNNTWAIKSVDAIKKDNLDMENFTENIGYQEYTWLLRKVKEKDKDMNFYKEFMGEFLKACNNVPMILSWELENMLTFANIPNAIKIEDNTIIDIDSNKIYTLDIFEDGTIDTGEVIQQWTLGSESLSTCSKTKKIKRYSFDLYEKLYDSSYGNLGKIKKINNSWIRSMFNMLCGIKNAKRSIKFETFKGYKIENIVVFEILGNIYIDDCKKLEPVRIATQAELYSIKRNSVYFSRKSKVTDIVNKVSIYSCNMSDGKVRLCKILFTY